MRVPLGGKMEDSRFINQFLRIRNSKFFNALVISVIIASALYAGVASYDIPPQYLYLLEIFDYTITIFFTVEILIRMIAERSLIKFFKGCLLYTSPSPRDRG